MACLEGYFMAKKNIIVSIAFSVFAVFVLLLSNNIPVSESMPLTMGTPSFPRFLSFGILVLSSILFLTNYKEALRAKKVENGNKTDLEPLKNVGGGLLILFLNVVIMVFTGFLPAMIIMNLTFLIYFKVKNKIVLVIEPLITPVLIYLVFQKVLNIPLPRGILF